LKIAFTIVLALYALALLSSCHSEQGLENQSLQYSLKLSADANVAGVQWFVNRDYTEADFAEITSNAKSAFGNDVVVLMRISSANGIANGTEWVAYLANSLPIKSWVISRTASNSANDLPFVARVSCADAFGNSIGCSLSWQLE
jgi:hypothetical protein